jgi:uncharacterized protein YyaL (SSP411 family)
MKEISNRLANSNSPYLLQHKDNPVDWYPWGEEALAKARQEDKPIFLSIGYAACHWCHVMAHESFEDPSIAAIMNEYFVNIKVDREERPDLDSIYMNAVVAMTGHGGWPMSVFLTPEGMPFFAGTYFPPTPRYNMPAFTDVLNGVANAWKEKRTEINKTGDQLTKHLRSINVPLSSPGTINPESLDQAALALAQSYDWKNGGWGQAPKFPQPMALEFLLRRAARGDRFALDIATHALRRMARGGMYDLIGGGFARYSTDNDWLIPHFEKMLYDNAQLARVYLHAYLITGDVYYRRVCEQTLDFIIREMTDPIGGFYSSIDADSEGGEGKFYLWSYDDIREVFPHSDEFEIINYAYGVTTQGNFEGKNILYRAQTEQAIAERFHILESEVVTYLGRLNRRLLEIRDRRIRPAMDDKVILAWNGMALVVFSEAARYLRRGDYGFVAMRNAGFLTSKLASGGQLLRSWRDGKSSQTAFLEDYAALILGLLSLYQTDPDPQWFTTSIHLAEQMLAHFRDPAGGFFDTRDDHEDLLLRPRDLQDNAVPSGNASATLALLQLAAYQGNYAWRDMSERMLGSMQELIVSHPTAFSQWLCALDFSFQSNSEVAILGDLQNPLAEQLVATLWSNFRPDTIVAISEDPPASGSPELLSGRHTVNNLPTAFVCRSFVCLEPTTSVEEFSTQLDSIHTR